MNLLANGTLSYSYPSSSIVLLGGTLPLHKTMPENGKKISSYISIETNIQQTNSSTDTLILITKTIVFFRRRGFRARIFSRAKVPFL